MQSLKKKNHKQFLCEHGAFLCITCYGMVYVLHDFFFSNEIE